MELSKLNIRINTPFSWSLHQVQQNLAVLADNIICGADIPIYYGARQEACEGGSMSNTLVSLRA